MRKNLQTIIFALIVAILLPGKSVYAANNNTAPYGYTYEDSASNRTMYEYYEYGKKSYACTREFYSMLSRMVLL